MNRREVEGMGLVCVEVGIKERWGGCEAYESGGWGKDTWPQIVEEWAYLKLEGGVVEQAGDLVDDDCGEGGEGQEALGEQEGGIVVGGDVGHGRGWGTTKCGPQMGDVAGVEGIGEYLVLEMT